MSLFSDRPFFWLAVDGQRHAITARDREVAVGGHVTTLCGLHPVRQPVTDFDGFWPTCMTCWASATELIDPHARD